MKMPKPSHALTGFLAMLLLTCVGVACSGGERTTPSVPAASDAAHHKRLTLVRVVIKVPKLPKHHRRPGRGRSPHYISPYTQAMTIVMTPQTVSPQPSATPSPSVNETVGLTPTSSGCESTAASTVCQLVLALAPGSYTANIATYDAYLCTEGCFIPEGANLLSDVDTVVTIVAGTNNEIPLTLDGVPAAMNVQTSSRAIDGSQQTGFQLYGDATQNLTVTALDADGYTIVGPGAPTYTAQVLSQSGDGAWGVTGTPATSHPNTIAVAPPNVNGATAVLRIVSTFTDGSTNCSNNSGCSVTVNLKNLIQNLLVLNQPSGGNGFVSVFSPPFSDSNAPLYNTSSLGGVYDMALDRAGNLYASVPGSSEVNSYALDPCMDPLTLNDTIGLSGTPGPLAIDPGGNAFVNVASAVDLVSAGTTSSNIYFGPFYKTTSMVLDSSSNLWVADCEESCGGELSDIIRAYYQPTAFTSPEPFSDVEITDGIAGPQSLAFDKAGDLFVANCSDCPTNDSSSLRRSPGHQRASHRKHPHPVAPSDDVTEYLAPYYNEVQATISGFTHPTQVILDGKANLWVMDEGANTISEFAPPYTGGANRVINVANNDPSPVLTQMILDGSGDVFVLDESSFFVDGGFGGTYGAVIEYAAPGYGSANILTSYMAGPIQMIVSSVPVSSSCTNTTMRRRRH